MIEYRKMQWYSIEFVVVSVYVLWTWIGSLNINDVIFVSKCGYDIWYYVNWLNDNWQYEILIISIG